MTSVRGRERSFAVLSVALIDSFPPSELGDKLSNQPVWSLGTKPLVVNTPIATISVLKYSKDDLQRIIKAVLKAWAPTLASTPIIAKVPWKKLKVCSPDVYYEKSHIDCYNFCQQCEDNFALVGATGLTRILFAMSFLWNRISFY